MCGIVAILSRSEPVEASALKRATNALHHRGPDGQRHWISEDGRVGLGHARLSIIDLATGDQPIASEDEQTRIIVNGEFYGYEAIQRELEARGHRLRTRSDSEIALHLFEDYGVQCLHQLRGEFAIVLWDARRRMIFAARDRFGIKPLFYAWHQDALHFASEAKALFAAGVPARWDEEAVYQSVAFGAHQVRTLFDGVHQIPPGHYLIATERHVQVAPYWDFNYPPKTHAVRTRIRGMTEKFVLRQAVRDVVTDTVYARQKHPFLSPPATLNPDDTFHTYVQDTLRGPALASMPFFDQTAVIALLDRLPAMDTGARVANDQVLMLLASMCALQERYAPSAGATVV